MAPSATNRAGGIRRTAAFAIDVLVVPFLTFLGLMASGLLLTEIFARIVAASSGESIAAVNEDIRLGQWGIVLLVLAGVGTLPASALLQAPLWRQRRSIGKACLGLHVVALDGGPISVWRVLARLSVQFAFVLLIPVTLVSAPSGAEWLVITTILAVFAVGAWVGTGHTTPWDYLLGTNVVQRTRR